MSTNQPRRYAADRRRSFAAGTTCRRLDPSTAASRAVSEPTDRGSASVPKLRALRGATTVAANDPEAIVAATQELLATLLARNDVAHEDLVSLVFTATPDLSAEFPAAAARRIGISDVPLLCAQEIDVPGAIPRCVRVLVHLYTSRDLTSLRHVYLGDARQLRTDLAG
jgi:chorismate mutase